MKSARLTKKEKSDLQRLREYFAIRKQTLPASRLPRQE
jgi:hypothetical protein